MIDFKEVTEDELRVLEGQRESQFNKVMSGIFVENLTSEPVINELRFNFGYLYLGNFLIDMTTGAKFELHINDDSTIHLAFIGVPDDKREKGLGTKMMEQLTYIADKYQYDVQLNIEPKFGVGKKVLKGFYKKYGFKETSMYKNNAEMVRKPKDEGEM
ncbi:N-acetyltransferase [Bacillus mycoides]|uniref:N-acetyltransferase n=1 Tax=Bacillus mycoides TaxID=1405 RepID=UPI003A8043A4